MAFDEKPTYSFIYIIIICLLKFMETGAKDCLEAVLNTIEKRKYIEYS